MKTLPRLALAALLCGGFPAHSQAQTDGKLRIIVFGAHPDDAQYKAGGTAAKWVKSGHKVKLVSVTNGDVGHWQSAGGPLAQLRVDLAVPPTR